MKLSFNNLSVVNADPEPKSVVNDSKAYKERNHNIDKPTTSNNTSYKLKPKKRRSRNKDKDNINVDIVLGKPCRPFGLIYNIYKPSFRVMNLATSELKDIDFESRSDKHKVFTGAAYIDFLSPKSLMFFLKSYTPIVTLEGNRSIDRKLIEYFQGYADTDQPAENVNQRLLVVKSEQNFQQLNLL